MNLVPINATWIAVWLYESTIATQQLIGMGLVIAAVYLTTTGHRPQHPKKSLISHEACS
jgi:drug/metabolite transporter (DMT)-like permease